MGAFAVSIDWFAYADIISLLKLSLLDSEGQDFINTLQQVDTMIMRRNDVSMRIAGILLGGSAGYGAANLVQKWSPSDKIRAYDQVRKKSVDVALEKNGFRGMEIWDQADVKIVLQRVVGTSKYTQGMLSIDGRFMYATLEDEHRDEKVRGETRIPAGVYWLGFREEETPLTKRYRQRFGWFDEHIEILDVPNFSDIYIHIGNDEKDTAGCPLIANKLVFSNGTIEESVKAYESFYKLVSKLMKDGKRVAIWIKDEHHVNVA